MNRYWLVPVLALACLAASPSTASAHFLFRCWGAPYEYAVPYPTPYFVPQYYFVPVPQSSPPPMVHPVPGAPPKKSGLPLNSPRSDTPVRPSPMVTVTPGMPPPAPLAEDPQVKPAVGGFAPPAPAPSPMSPLIPDPMVPKVPPPPVVPPLVLPGTSDAKPMPAPAPTGTDPLPLIPLPEPRKVPPAGKDSKDPKTDLPPLVLPPDGTGTSSGVIPSTSRSSPISSGMKVQVFSANGAVSGSLRKIGFFNHTDRDLDLVIEGKTVKLPKKSYLHAELPVKFTWKAAGRDSTATTVPDGAAGVDVLFKE